MKAKWLLAYLKDTFKCKIKFDFKATFNKLKAYFDELITFTILLQKL